jgi:hypothetical protein
MQFAYPPELPVMRAFVPDGMLNDSALRVNSEIDAGERGFVQLFVSKRLNMLQRKLMNGFHGV